ncbi:la-related protein 7 isoform X2 [Mycetomoellerius zeteki]|uniref:la-related protein 7 isoform X2 n=1 Tax=Mycetomoellerius zeteki TaxID=64791 RepID=UPI00084E83B3|nr:PREDICTED: la-related protein 7 isoform X2 [Trachymyrmex zeteki]
MVMEESDMELASESIPVPQVQEPIVDTVKRNNKPGVSRGKPRLRKKALHASILKQMEFYFSDANLNKDRYLSGLLKESPYVDLEVFTRFNKLRELTTDTNRIAKALQGSTILKVSEDGTKVCRLTPIQKKEDIDQCTIYVQNLPPDSDHDWLISIFSKYGSVEYVSIPRYRNNKKIKGFAFVEFDKPSSAQECIKTFRKKRCVLPSYISPNELLSITTFDEPNKDAVVEVINSKTKTRLKDNENEKASNEVGNIGRKGLRLKRLMTEEEETETKDESDVKVKKKKKEVADQNIIDQDEGKKVPKYESEDKSDTLDNETDAADNNSKQKFKKRKYSSEKFVADESQEKDIKVKKKKKTTDQNIAYQQNEKEKVLKEESKDKDNTCDNDVPYNNDRQSSKKEKYALEKSLVSDESDVKVKKRRKTIDQSTIDQQNEKEKVLKEESEDKTNAYDNETDIAGNNGRQNLKKRKLALEKSYIKDERDSKVTGNSIENQEIPNKNRNKITEKKKRRLTINDTITTEDNNGEAVKKECQKSAINSNKNETTELEYPHENNDNNKGSALLQTEKHSTSDFGARNSDIEETSDERKKKKNRKKRSKIHDNDIYSKIGLQIMAKSDWKRLRNRYLDLQRYKMKQLKVHLRKAEVERDGIIKNGYHDKTGQTNTLHDKSKHENDNGKLEEKSCGRVNYAPGIIVKIEMDEPCTDTQSFKMKLKDNNSIKYVDVIADSCEVYVRCDTAEAAQTFAQQSYEGGHLTILEGDEEKLYWDKIVEDRMEKLSKKKRVKQRGRDKLLKRAEKELGKCIKFDQD